MKFWKNLSREIQYLIYIILALVLAVVGISVGIGSQSSQPSWVNNPPNYVGLTIPLASAAGIACVNQQTAAAVANARVEAAAKAAAAHVAHLKHVAQTAVESQRAADAAAAAKAADAAPTPIIPVVNPAPPVSSGCPSGNLSQSQLEQLWIYAGGNPNDALIASAVAEAESSGQQYAADYDSNGTVDRGYWQVNSTWGGLSTFDPLGNAKAAIEISNDGTNWTPWVTYDTGAYLRYM